jgi:hypothetical protein
VSAFSADALAARVTNIGGMRRGRREAAFPVPRVACMTGACATPPPF